MKDSFSLDNSPIWAMYNQACMQKENDNPDCTYSFWDVIHSLEPIFINDYKLKNIHKILLYKMMELSCESLIEEYSKEDSCFRCDDIYNHLNEIKYSANLLRKDVENEIKKKKKMHEYNPPKEIDALFKKSFEKPKEKDEEHYPIPYIETAIKYLESKDVLFDTLLLYIEEQKNEYCLNIKAFKKENPKNVLFNKSYIRQKPSNVPKVEFEAANQKKYKKYNFLIHTIDYKETDWHSGRRNGR